MMMLGGVGREALAVGGTYARGCTYVCMHACTCVCVYGGCIQYCV
jgi:hypothetical protein